MTKTFAPLVVAAALMVAGTSYAEAWSRSGGGTGPRGNSWTSSGSGSCSGGTCTRSGTVTGPAGKTITRGGTVTKY